MKRFLLTIGILLLFTTIASAASRFAVCTVTCTWDGSSTAMWSATSGGATGASVPGVADGVTFDNATCVGGVTCTITVNTNVSINFLVFGACTGSTTGCILDFSVNNNNVTLASQYIGNGSGTRTLKMGNGLWRISASTGIIWDTSATTNFTLVANSSTLSIGVGVTSVPTFSTGIGAGVTYSTLQITGGVQIIGGAGTFQTNNLTVVAPAYISLASSTNLTVNTAFAVTSSSSTNQVGFIAATINSSATMRLPSSSTMAWVSLRDMNFTGSGSTPTATNSFNLGNNSNVTITAPGAGGSGGCILGGWLLWRDMPGNLNDNFPAWLDKAA